MSKEKEEFIKKFKVGDKLTNEHRDNDGHYVEIISYKGVEEDQFTGLDNETGKIHGEFGAYVDAWELYKKEPEKDLEGVTKYYAVTKYNTGVLLQVTTCYRHERPGSVKSSNGTTEYLTEEEAIARGLKP